MKDGIKILLDTTKALREKYKMGFPLDGRLVGDIGEALVKRDFFVELYPQNHQHHDAYELDTDNQIQIKASMKYNFSYPYKYKPDYYIAVHINEDATLEVIYNGPGNPIEDYIIENKRKDYNKTWYSITVGTLKSLNKKIDDKERIKKRADLVNN